LLLNASAILVRGCPELFTTGSEEYCIAECIGRGYIKFCVPGMKIFPVCCPARGTKEGRRDGAPQTAKGDMYGCCSGGSSLALAVG